MNAQALLVLTLCGIICAAPSNPLSPSQSDDPSSTVTVIASGTGRTEVEALNQAFVNAVQSAVGMIVDAETVVKNDEIIREQILTASSAIITRYDQIESAKADSGLINVRIKAMVQKSALIARLSKARVITIPVAGSDLWAEARTRVNNATDARAMLEKRVPEIVLSLLTAKLVDDDGRDLDVATKCTQRPDTNKASIWCAWNVQVSIDRSVYYSEVSPRLRNLFQALGEGGGKTIDRDSSAGEEPSLVSINKEPVRWWEPNKVEGAPRAIMDAPEFPILLGVRGDSSMEHQRFTIYKMSRDYTKLLQRAFAPASLRVTLIRRDGSEMRSSLISFTENLMRRRGYSWNQKSSHHSPVLGTSLNDFAPGKDPRFGLVGTWEAWYGPLWITPEFGFPGFGAINSLMFRYETDLDPDDLKDLKEMRLTFERAPAND